MSEYGNFTILKKRKESFIKALENQKCKDRKDKMKFEVGDRDGDFLTFHTIVMCDKLYHREGIENEICETLNQLVPQIINETVSRLKNEIVKEAKEAKEVEWEAWEAKEISKFMKI